MHAISMDLVLDLWHKFAEDDVYSKLIVDQVEVNLVQPLQMGLATIM